MLIGAKGPSCFRVADLLHEPFGLSHDSACSCTKERGATDLSEGNASMFRCGTGPAHRMPPTKFDLQSHTPQVRALTARRSQARHHKGTSLSF